MTPTKQRAGNGPFARLGRWLDDPANRKTALWIAGLVISALGGAGLKDMSSKVPVTRGELDTAKAEIMAIAAQAVDGYAERNDHAFGAYRDSLQAKEQWYRENVAVPMLSSMEDLSQRVARIEKLQGLTVQKIDQSDQHQRDVLGRIDAQVDDLTRNGHYDGEMAEIMKLLRDQAAEIRAIKEQLPVRRSSKPNLP